MRKQPIKKTKNKNVSNRQDSGRNQSGLRAYNERRILSLLRQLGHAPKAEISQLTGLSAQSITVIMNELEKEQLVLKLPPVKGKVGQPSVPFCLNPEGAFGIGLKIGRRSYELTLIDFCGNVKATLKENFSYPKIDTLLKFLDKGSKSIMLSLSSIKIAKIAGVGVATPYEIWNWAEQAGAPDSELTLWKDFDFSLHVKSVFNLPVYICNDDTAACSAELSFGNSEKFSDFLYAFIGTFIGGAVVLNGTLFTGKNGNAGAIGSLPQVVIDEQGNRRTNQLIMQSSIYILEEKLNAEGVDSSQLFKSTDYWSDLGTIVDDWIEQVSSGLAQTALTSLALLDLEGIVIDGSLPTEIRKQIVDKTLEKLSESDFRGLNRCKVVAGTIGAKAQSIGSASLPLLASFSHESEHLFTM
jgi:predicted NBD/HSP70 family sugar kinase